MKLVKIGNKYFNFDHFQRAEIGAAGSVTLTFRDAVGDIISNEEWQAVLKKAQLGIIDIGSSEPAFENTEPESYGPNK